MREDRVCGITSPTDFLTESVILVTETSLLISSIVTRYFSSLLDPFFDFLLHKVLQLLKICD